MVYEEYASWLCPVCSTPVYVCWEDGCILCPACDREEWESEMEFPTTEEGRG
jgi:uncharacterized Zn finger protein (UPF0148 family)